MFPHFNRLVGRGIFTFVLITLILSAGFGYSPLTANADYSDSLSPSSYESNHISNILAISKASNDNNTHRFLIHNSTLEAKDLSSEAKEAINDINIPGPIPSILFNIDLNSNQSGSISSPPGNVWVWGTNEYGVFGTGIGDLDPHSLPVQVSGLMGLTAIAAADYYSLAVKNDGTVWAWGVNQWGVLGTGAMVSTGGRSTPIQVVGLTGITAITASGWDGLALDDNGVVWAWGSNDECQLGIGIWDPNPHPSPVSVPGLTDIVAIAGGPQHSLVLKSDGTVWAWGLNLSGEIGNGSDNNVICSPVLVSEVPGLNNVTAIAVGAHHSLALDSNGEVWAWGSNWIGQLGIGISDQNPHSSPVPVPGLTDVVAIAAGDNDSFALKKDKTVVAWGVNQLGQLGDGTTTDSYSPKPVSGLTGVTAIVGSANFSLALKNDGTVWAWGYNKDGELGDGSTNDSYSPVPVKGLKGATAIAANDRYSLAISSTFLDLPLHYTTAFSVAALGNYGDNRGLVNSWFDHDLPNYTKNHYLYPWFGDHPIPDPDLPKVCEYGINCYDGHNGIDFQANEGDPVYAAGPGIVIDFCNNYPCSRPTGVITSDIGYGKWVLIRHGTQYATFYAHLDSINPNLAKGTKITDTKALPIGTVGKTGTRDKHLHFGVYYDYNKNEKWEETYQGYTEAVDPYGWQHTSPDPWNIPSTYLWIHSLSTPKILDNLGGNVTAPSGNSSITVPASAVSNPVTLEIWDLPPVGIASVGLRSTGNSFWVRILEWLTGGSSSALLASASTNSFDVPVTVNVHYDTASMPHFDINQLGIYQWDDLGQTWIALSTTFDAVNQQASAQTNQPGYFDLQAPLVCPADTLEPNDHYDRASLINTEGVLVNNLFDVAQDEDWFKFNGIARTVYAIQTKNLAAGVDTVLEIYNSDGVTLLMSDDNGGGGNASSLIWQPPQNGLYFLRVARATNSGYGCNATYQLSVVPNYKYRLFLPFLRMK